MPKDVANDHARRSSRRGRLKGVLIVFALITIALGLLLAVLIVRAWNPTPGSAIDFRAKAEELVERYLPPEARAEQAPDAWPELAAAIESVEAVTSRRDEFLHEDPPADWPSSFAFPYDLTRFHLPSAPKQCVDNTLAVIARIRAEGVDDRLAAIVGLSRITLPPSIIPDHPFDFTVIVAARRVNHYAIARMQLAASRGDWADFAAAFEQALAVSRLIAHQPLVIERLVASAIRMDLLERVSVLATQGLIDSDTALNMIAALDRQPLPSVRLQVEGEGLFVHFHIQQTHTDDGAGSGRRILSLHVDAELSHPLNFVLGTDFDLPLDDLRIWNVLGYLLPSKRQLLDRLAEFQPLALAYADDVAAGRTPTSELANWNKNLPRQYDFLHSITRSVLSAISADRRTSIQTNGVKLLLAIEAFRSQNGRPPASLDELVPAILPEIPPDLASGKPWIYKVLKPGEDPASRPYLLYSVGSDGIDNLGTPSKLWFDAVTGKAPGTDWVVNSPTQSRDSD